MSEDPTASDEVPGPGIPPLRVVVVSADDTPLRAGLATALADAIAKSGDEDAGDAHAVTAAKVAAADELRDAQVAVALDGASLEHARDAGVPICIAYEPTFAVGRFGIALAEADQVFVAQDALVPAAVRNGAPRDRIEVVGCIAPIGFAPVDDRDRACRVIDPALGDSRRLLITREALEVFGLETLLLQLSLVSGSAGTDGAGAPRTPDRRRTPSERPGSVEKVSFLFEVGTDVALADALRQLIPVHGLRAFMFGSAATGDDQGLRRYLPLADRVIVVPESPKVLAALAAGAPLLCVDRRPPDAAVDGLESLGVADSVGSTATMAVAIEESLTPASLASARAQVEALDLAGGAARVAAAVREVWRRRRRARLHRPSGLPSGLERLFTEGAVPGPRPVDADDDRLAGAVERELAALKAKLDRD